jgi:hypothetical protein
MSNNSQSTEQLPQHAERQPQLAERQPQLAERQPQLAEQVNGERYPEIIQNSNNKIIWWIQNP